MKGRGEAGMRRKYTICREKDSKKLSIKEYAILEKTPKNPVAPIGGEELFSFTGEETYDGSAIEVSMGGGRDVLAAALRTKGMFPIWPDAVKIAESVMALYDLDAGVSVDLFFNDIEQLGQRSTTAV
jgi:hypothetical protein